MSGARPAARLLLVDDDELIVDALSVALEDEFEAGDTAAVAAQKLHRVIDGRRGVHFCGAYWGNGFHEDGVRSAMAIGRAFGQEL